jgi:hypothetical protein|nr:MAG TPA: hypothetical protein [Bacteriophage sp.]
MFEFRQFSNEAIWLANLQAHSLLAESVAPGGFFVRELETTDGTLCVHYHGPDGDCLARFGNNAAENRAFYNERAKRLNAVA